jgi:glutamine synthetase
VAADHQQLLMSTLKRIAQKHGMECLFHEKPFEGINGSGKHVNFSLGNSTEGNLLLPGDTPHANAQFLVFCAAVVRSVHKYGGLLRASVASASNDHRLGANEAPPAIISIFLGDQLTDVFDQIAKSGGATSSKAKGTLEIGVDTLPVLPTDPGDRNRTSPFAFTGNRFEFRAPGSLQSIAGPMVTINTILAEALDYLATELEGLVAEGTEFNAAVQKVLEDIITVHGSVIFNGDGYTEAWPIEAEARGLPNLRTTVDALPQLVTEDSLELFSRYGVFSRHESHSRYEIALEQYVLSVGVEARLTLEMANTVILPAALRYQTELAANLASLKAIDAELDTTTLDEVSAAIKTLRAGIATLRAEIGHDHEGSAEEQAAHIRDNDLPAMNAVRAATDELETLVADDLWPLATYQEMLFIL